MKLFGYKFSERNHVWDFGAFLLGYETLNDGWEFESNIARKTYLVTIWLGFFSFWFRMTKVKGKKDEAV